ncbi:ABC-2 type transport system permease protein [Pelomonas saccharophila]|uniref:ABC-2 type transport system permease protein n=1 Tax=Roseateles saccharophilus TaxID=304 RepID=A0ABU1YMQ3_ROSSA|nr:ABC transporter permease [Roseateles saccharophilus]MDR7270138.1 ABC-2 type transport system permease protein [Roseateles saccharophilus]
MTALTQSVPVNRTLAVYAIEIRLELIRLLRMPAFALPMFLLPVATYLLFAFAVAGEMVAKDPDAGRFMFGGFSVMAVTMAALFATCPNLAMEREQGLLTLKRAQPAPPGAWLTAKIVAGVACGTLAYLPILVLAAATGQAHLSGAQFAAMSAVLTAGTLPFCALGVMLGALTSGSAAPAYANLAYLPGLYLSGVFFPLPKSMHFQTAFWPHFHLDQLVFAAGGVTKLRWMAPEMAVTVLLGFTVLCSAVALYRLKRRG